MALVLHLGDDAVQEQEAAMQGLVGWAQARSVAGQQAAQQSPHAAQGLGAVGRWHGVLMSEVEQRLQQL